MTRSKIIRWVFSFLLILVIWPSPYFLFYGLASLAAPVRAYSSLLFIVGGYLALIVSLIIILWKPGIRNIPIALMILVPAGLIPAGLYLGQQFTIRYMRGEYNDKLCAELRAEPSCKEDACDFTCEKFHGHSFTTGASICKNKDMNLCINQALEGENRRANRFIPKIAKPPK